MMTAARFHLVGEVGAILTDGAGILTRLDTVVDVYFWFVTIDGTDVKVVLEIILYSV